MDYVPKQNNCSANSYNMGMGNTDKMNKCQIDI
jgi:hypothetical protein